MAVVVWVYAGGGQAELGIIPWLDRFFPGVRFERRTPQIRKPGPRPGIVTRHEVVGQTGTALDREIRTNSKDTDTRRLLQQADPEAVGRRCPHFRAFWVELKGIVGAHA